MARISKDADVRKNELIEVAEGLFLENGYDRTSVNDIVKATGIAQGTFYYHFKSKEHMLEAVAEKLISGIEQEVRADITPSHDHVGKRLNDMINVLFKIKMTSKQLLEDLHKDSNILLHNKLSKKTIDRLIPIFTDVINEGIAKKQLHVDYPDETAEILASTIHYVWHLQDLTDQRHERIRISLEQILARTIGLDDSYTFHFDLQ